MKKLVAALMITAMAGLGCGQESEPGGPGAEPVTVPNGNGNGTEREMRDEEATFTIVVPELTTSVEAGQTETVSISMRPGERFQESVTLEFQAPQGVQFQPQNPTLTPEQDEAEVAITVQPGTPPGEHEVRVTATPQSGVNPTHATFTLEIEAAEGAQDTRQPAPRDPALQQQPGAQQPGLEQPGAQRQPGLEQQDPALQQPPADQP